MRAINDPRLSENRSHTLHQLVISMFGKGARNLSEAVAHLIHLRFPYVADRGPSHLPADPNIDHAR